MVKRSKIEKHLEIINYLKAEYGFSYGFAIFVALKTKKSDAASINDLDVYKRQLLHIILFGNGKVILSIFQDKLMTKKTL